MKQIRRHTYFSGRVQGVGFRFTACYLASHLGLTGWVKNLCDGRVEMEVQGTEDYIDLLILRLKEGRYIQIENMETEELTVQTKESGFRETW